MRYQKQELINGWNQGKLKNSKITLIGSNNLSSFIFMDLIAMGFGNITKIGKSSLPFLEFEKLNPDVETQVIPGEILNKVMAKEFIGNADFIIDISEPVKQKKVCLQYVKENNILSIFAERVNGSYSINFFDNYKNIEDTLKFQENKTTSEEGITNSIVLSGIIVDELRKRIMPLKDDKKLKKFYFNAYEEDINKKVLMVGAGGIGTFAGISLAMKGADVDVIDFDIVEESNLNRQILFYDSLKQYKSKIMAEKLSKIRNGKFNSIVDKIDRSYSLNKNYDVILSCVDNSEARYHLDNISHKKKIPLINSGTSVFAGIVMPYVYGKTACLDCQTFGKLREYEEQKQRSCYEPNIIISNQIIGGLLANKIPKIFEDKLNTLKYNSNTGIKKINTLEKCLGGCEKNG